MSKIWEDKILRLLFFNILLVIIGYAMAGLTGMTSNAIMTPFKTLVLAYSIYQTGKCLSRQEFEWIKKDFNILLLFIGLIFVLLFFSIDFFKTIERTSQFIIPFVYVFLITSYLSLRYPKQESWFFFILILNGIYALPILYFMLFGGGFSAKDIYGIEEGEAFASNHYGWASLVFILTFYDLIKNYELPTFYKWAGYMMIIPAIYLLIISGNRASYLSFVIVTVVFILRHKGTNWAVKIIFAIGTFVFVTNQLNQEGTILNERLKKTELQLEDEEENKDTRRTARQTGIEVMDKHPETYITGFGLFSFREAILAFEPSTSFDRIRSGVHNSYLELFFGSGIIVFSLFLMVYIISPLYKYLIQYSDKLLFVLPVFIIPFFESNLTGGQFLFYPWLVTAMLLKFYD